jgi:symplekin
MPIIFQARMAANTIN